MNTKTNTETYKVNDIVRAIAGHYSFLEGMIHDDYVASEAEAQLVLAVLAELTGAWNKWTANDMAQILVDANMMPQEEAKKFADSCVDEYGTMTLY